MNDQKIKDILGKYKESYAPWEEDGGNCIPYEEDGMIKFAKEIYNLALEDAAKNMIYDMGVNKSSILKLKI